MNARPAKRSFTKDKEPKFVPYEPYKAAVTPLTNDTSNKMKKPTNAITEKYKKSIITRSESNDNNDNDKTRLNHSIGSASETYLDISDSKEVRKLLEEKDREMARLTQQLAEKEKQLRIQTQVKN